MMLASPHQINPSALLELRAGGVEWGGDGVGIRDWGKSRQDSVTMFQARPSCDSINWTGGFTLRARVYDTPWSHWSLWKKTQSL